VPTKGAEYDEADANDQLVSSAILELKEAARLKVELGGHAIGTHVHNFVAVAEQGADPTPSWKRSWDGTASPEVEIIRAEQSR